MSGLNQEEKILEEFKTHLGKNTGMIVYGLEQVKKALEFNAISKLIVLDSLIKEVHIRELVSAAEKKNVEVHFVSDDDSPGLQLKGFTGIIAFLHYKLTDLE